MTDNNNNSDLLSNENELADTKQLGMWAAICSLGYVFWLVGGMQVDGVRAGQVELDLAERVFGTRRHHPRSVGPEAFHRDSLRHVPGRIGDHPDQNCVQQWGPIHFAHPADHHAMLGGDLPGLDELQLESRNVDPHVVRRRLA